VVVPFWSQWRTRSHPDARRPLFSQLRAGAAVRLPSHASAGEQLPLMQRVQVMSVDESPFDLIRGGSRRRRRVTVCQLGPGGEAPRPAARRVAHASRLYTWARALTILRARGESFPGSSARSAGPCCTYVALAATASE